MDLRTQVRNSEATARLSRPRPPFTSEDKATSEHVAALQGLADGRPVPYGATLRVVVHEGSRDRAREAPKLKVPPGYARNEAGRHYRV